MEYELVRLMMTDSKIYNKQKMFNKMFELCYVYAISESAAEGEGSYLKFKGDGRSSLGAVRLATEEIVDKLAPLPGDEESFAERFALIVSRDPSFRNPVVERSKFRDGQVVDRINSKKSSFRYDKV